MRKGQVLVIFGVIAALAGGSVLTACQSSAGPSGVGDGPAMLYFYATW